MNSGTLYTRESTITIGLCLLATVPGVLLNLVVIYISVYKVDKPYKWFLANLAVTDLTFASANVIGQPLFMLAQLKGRASSLEQDYVRWNKTYCTLLPA